MMNKFNYGNEKKCVDKILDLYAKHPNTSSLESNLADLVKTYGENKDLHIFYLATITVTIQEIVQKNNYELVKDMVRPHEGFVMEVFVDSIARTIYLMRKNLLGLKSLTCDTSDFCFDIATENCGFSINRVLINKMMETIRQQTIDILPSLKLDKTEIIRMPLLLLNDRFEFHKILHAVFTFAYIIKLHLVEGVYLWVEYVIAYEIANKIYIDYIKARKDVA